MKLYKLTDCQDRKKPKEQRDVMQDIMTIRELERYLRIPLSTLYHLGRLGKLPGRKVGRKWRFKRADVDAWLRCAERSAQPVANRREKRSGAARTVRIQRAPRLAR